MSENVNSVVLSGRLTRDPELRTLPSGNTVCSIRMAVNGRRKNSYGEFEDVPGFYDVTVWGNRGEAVARYLAKGRRILVRGRLQWREWETQDGHKRQAVEVVADQIEFIDFGDDKDGGGGGGFQRREPEVAPDLPTPGAEDFQPAATPQYGVPGAGHSDDDIPF